ncbi:Glucose 1-dehydrogenase [Usitatibacter rugosus]|uniref:Glucose 1-dehydrogenase n=1 Tax=Usitatibacter rugosus TaxID=2732067 RepID=A0A6M4GYZ1_9PROT|nr:pteridine reductase [Usitatibacter rugosus]QJR12480.1 Glucose 1-dehydrogenase [Usitatibacter rugosus]
MQDSGLRRETPVVLVTGAARRIGRAIAMTLHAAGARVILHCHHSCDEAETLAAELDAVRASSAAVVSADLLDAAGLPDMIGIAASTFGRLDGLVNNASSFHATPMGSIGAREWDDLVGTNLRAPLLLAQAAAPHLRKARGAIVNIVDIHAERPLRDFAVYTVAKGGLAALTRSLAVELAPEVRVNGVAPGAILWPEDGKHFSGSERARIEAQTPLGRIGNPADVAGAVKYLLLDAPFVTGQILAVDGGRSLSL